jgi:uncharacterized protein (TIGR02996 family)
MNLEQLYQNVYEKPADDTRRRVLADALLERGDPRGELIVLQFQTHALARKRAKKLIERHRVHFLGPLSGVVLHGTDEWERGFLAGCWARLSGSTADCAAWATVKRLQVVGGGAREPAELGSTWMRSLAEVRFTVDGDNFMQRQQALFSARARLVRVLERANRLRLLKA